MAAYANVGARIQEDISEASVIFGVKQVSTGHAILVHICRVKLEEHGAKVDTVR